MSSTELELDAYNMANEGGNVYFFKSIEEKIFALEQKVKKTIDAGLPPEEFKQAELASQAVRTAADIVKVLQD